MSFLEIRARMPVRIEKRAQIGQLSFSWSENARQTAWSKRQKEKRKQLAAQLAAISEIWDDNLVSRREMVCQLLMKKMETLIKWMNRVKKYENRGAAIFTA